MSRGKHGGPGARGSAIHRGLVGRQALLGSPYLADPELRAQYAREIAPRTEVQLARVLDELERLWRPVGALVAAAAAPLRALDLGAGTGAVGRVLRARLGARVELTAVDRVAGPGILVADLTRAVRPAGVPGRFDLVTAAHVLCELRGLDVQARARLVLGWLHELLAPSGTLVLIEPALRETGRDLLTVRDRIVADGWQVVAPCIFQGPCPALQRARDWCHDSAPWDGPVGPGAAPVAGAGRADFAYLVVRRPGAPEPGAPLRGGPLGGDARFRVVSDLLHEKGRLRVWGCGAPGRHALVLQRRDVTPANQALAEVRRGECVRVAGATPMGDGLRVGPGCQVTREPAEPTTRELSTPAS